MSLVLVTGGSGYLGTHLIAALLRDGRSVRTTVRSTAREAELRAAVRRGGADDTNLELVAADLMTVSRTVTCEQTQHHEPGKIHEISIARLISAVNPSFHAGFSRPPR